MTGKSRRVASRQGELSRRKRRGPRGPSGIPETTSQPEQNGAVITAAVEAGEATTATATAAPQAAAAPRPAVPRNPAQARGQGRPRGERPAAYNYVGAELRRIGVLSTVVVAALIVIAVVL